MKDKQETADWATILKSAGEALEERPDLLAELERLREVESAAMKVCTTYLFHNGNILDRVDAVKDSIKRLHGTIHDGRKRTKGYLN